MHEVVQPCTDVEHRPIYDPAVLRHQFGPTRAVVDMLDKVISASGNQSFDGISRHASYMVGNSDSYYHWGDFSNELTLVDISQQIRGSLSPAKSMYSVSVQQLATGQLRTMRWNTDYNIEVFSSSYQATVRKTNFLKYLGIDAPDIDSHEPMTLYDAMQLTRTCANILGIELEPVEQNLA